MSKPKSLLYRWGYSWATRVSRAWLSSPQYTLSLAAIFLWLLAIAIGPFLIHWDPLAVDLGHRLEAPSYMHWFGTDALGRDVLVRVLEGGRISLPSAATVVAIGLGFGTLVGLVAGYVGGIVDEVAMRVTDVFLAFPVIILAMAVAAALGPGTLNGILALAVVWWPHYARVVRGLVLSIRDREFVLASITAGSGPMRTLLKVVLPNVISQLVILAAFDVGRAILNFAILGFLGLGAQPPYPEWGSSTAEGAQVMDYWWVSTFPALAILSLAAAFNFIGDSTRDRLDPWLRPKGR